MSSPRGEPLSDWTPFGTLQRPHGVRGEVRLAPFASGDVLPAIDQPLQVRWPDGSVRLLEIEHQRPVHKGILVHFAGIDSRDAAAALQGAELSIPTGAIEPPAAGEHYSYELIGAAVFDDAGNLLGTVQSVTDNGGQELLSLDTPAGERLYPLASGTFIAFDRERRRLTVRHIAGLWDDA